MLNNIENLFAIDDFEPLEGWEPLTASLFHKWDGTDADARPLDTPVHVDWNINQQSSNGTAIAGFANVDHDDFADLTPYDQLVIRGKGGNLRILANRLVAHGPWKEIKVTFNEKCPYWDKDLKAVVLPLEDLQTLRTSSNEDRFDDFVHLNAIKVDWGNTATVTSIWLVPKATTDIHSLTATSTTPSDHVYRNLSGLRVNDTYKGIIITNGKKILNR